MDDTAVAWIHRRAGFGLHPDELDEAGGSTVDETLDQLLSEAGQPVVDPWDGIALDREPESRRRAVVAWLLHLVASTQPYSDRRTWMLHGWLVSSLNGANHPQLMADQIRLLRTQGGGRFPDLLRSITVDAAMLVYLDGTFSTAEAPNENYGRELLELFSLGVGNYSEDDVEAASHALTGWVVRRETLEVRFVPGRHDPTPRTLLGSGGVHDVDTVVEAIVDRPEHARFVAGRIAREYLGDPDDPSLDGVVDVLADAYVENDLALDPVIATALGLGIDGAATRLVLAPIPWFAISCRVCGVDPLGLGRDELRRLPELGQIPLIPPDVSGWPSGATWFTSSSMVARTAFAAAIARTTSAGEPIRVALDDGDLDLVARRLGLSGPFSTATATAIDVQSDPVDRLTLALVCPENLLS